IIINGLKSRNPEERREWAQTPLYQYRAYLSADDFANASSGWYGELHLWSREHAVYNQAVKELWDKNKYNPSKMTKRDAEDFLEQVRRSRDPRIATFRNMINDKRLKYELSSGARPHGGD